MTSNCCTWVEPHSADLRGNNVAVGVDSYCVRGKQHDGNIQEIREEEKGENGLLN